MYVYTQSYSIYIDRKIHFRKTPQYWSTHYIQLSFHFEAPDCNSLLFFRYMCVLLILVTATIENCSVINIYIPYSVFFPFVSSNYVYNTKLISNESSRHFSLKSRPGQSVPYGIGKCIYGVLPKGPLLVLLLSPARFNCPVLCAAGNGNVQWQWRLRAYCSRIFTSTLVHTQWDCDRWIQLGTHNEMQLHFEHDYVI